MIQKTVAAQRLQLGRKFQFPVDLGNGFLTDKAGVEIMKYISISQRIKNIMQPLNENILNYYSVLFDGASSSKCVDEKELFVIKLCLEGKPIFHICLLKSPRGVVLKGLRNQWIMLCQK